MVIKTVIKRSEYHDSVSLMVVAKELAGYPGVLDAAVVMATEANKGLLESAGLLTSEAIAATPNDLLIAVSAESDVQATQALIHSDKLLQQKQATTETGDYRPRTLAAALKSSPAANIAVISVAGRYAADEAWEALRKDLHVLLFSDNVSLADEIALKQYAASRGLLLMGPGAGTAILNGVALGFANVVPHGPVGIVSAAGTGLQEVSTLLARNGIGITQGIGTGGRDLKEEVGGIMMLAGLQALQEDQETQVILLVSKPPSPSVTEAVLDQIAEGSKRAVVCFLGGDPRVVQAVPNASPATTLEEAAYLAARLAGADLPALEESRAETARANEARIEAFRAKRQPTQRYLRGLFSGGTLCYEAQVIWQDMLVEPVKSNAPLKAANRLQDSNRSQGHAAVDLGEEEFTVGRPHPMIDNDLRIRRLLQEARDPETAVIMLDIVLGYGAHPDPAAELAPAAMRALALAAEAGRVLVLVASVTGTEDDPQRLSRQVKALQDAGIIVCESNAAAARLAAQLVGNGHTKN